MKPTKHEHRKTNVATQAAQPGQAWWPYALGALAAVIAAFWAYSPALHGPFLFDDTILPFARTHVGSPLRAWISGVRPVLMATYWANLEYFGEDPYSFHVVNVILHCLTSGLMFLLVRRFLEWSGETKRRDLLAGFAAFLFLLHPVQTEAVAYLAGRSETLTVMLVFAAFTIFVYRRQTAISWITSVAILALAGVAVLSKEHAVALAALLLLTDYWWNPGFQLGGILRNWKLYVLMAAGGVAGVVHFWGLLTNANTAGFGMKDFTWYQYFFTQCRALWVYLRLFLLPVGQNVDYDFPISKDLLDHGAIVGLIALLILAGAAWFYRRRFPLACYGFFAFLLLMAPTSSILPIKDPVAERRLYLALFGLLLVLVDVLRRVRLKPEQMAAGLGAILLLAAVATYQRATVWSDGLLLWEDTVAKAPANSRAHFQLASAYYDAGKCDASTREYQKTASLMPINYELLVDWALAYDCLNRPDDALAKLRQAAMLDSTAHVYSQIGMVYAKRQRWAEASEALAMARKLDPRFLMTYVYLGGVHLSTNQPAEAVQDYQRALHLDPGNQQAQEGLAMATRRLRGGR